MYCLSPRMTKALALVYIHNIKSFITIITDRQQSCGKVMFSQTCVILSTGGNWGGYVWSHVFSLGDTPRGPMSGGGMSTPLYSSSGWGGGGGEYV